MVFLVPIVHLRVETAAGLLRRVDLDGLFEEEPMVIYGVLGLKEARDVKSLHDRLAVRRADIKSHLKVVGGALDVAERAEDRAYHRDSLVVTLLHVEPDHSLGIRHPRVSRDQIRADHAGKHGLGRGDIFKTINFDLEVPAFHDGPRLGVDGVGSFMVRDHFPLARRDHKVVRLFEDVERLSASGAETLLDAARSGFRVGLRLVPNVVVPHESGLRTEIVGQVAVGSRSDHDFSRDRADAVGIGGDIGEKGLRSDS